LIFLKYREHDKLNRKQIANSIKQTIRAIRPLEGFKGHLFIAGAQKAGTSSLFAYLSGHPLLCGADIKETEFFSRDDLFEKGGRYYRTLFPVSAVGRYSVDATPEYMYHKCCAERIYELFPENTKIVMLLREPASRGFSAFNMYQQIYQKRWFAKHVNTTCQNTREFFQPYINGTRALSIESFIEREMEIISSNIDLEEPSLIRRGLYASQIERYIQLFGRDNVLILFSDELRINPEKCVKRVLELIGLPTIPKQDYSMKHVRNYTVDGSVKNTINQYAKKLFDKDRGLLGEQFGLTVPWK